MVLVPAPVAAADGEGLDAVELEPQALALDRRQIDRIEVDGLDISDENLSAERKNSHEIVTLLFTFTRRYCETLFRAVSLDNHCKRLTI